MQLLDAAIAFTLTIAGFATVVSIIVEIIHRALSLRSKGLQAMLEQHFNDVIKPTIERKLKQKLKAGGRKLETELARLRENLIDKMTGNPLTILQDMSWLPKRIVNAISQYNEVTALDFIKRLPETDVYELIELPGQGTAVERLAKFDRKYQEYEKAISNYFKRRAQVLSFIVGIALALAVNIHGVRLFERYLNDPELTAMVIAQSEKIEAAVATVKERQDRDPDTAREQLQEIKSAFDQYNELMDNFLGSGLPIGWSYYPNCPAGQSAQDAGTYDPRCKAVMASEPDAADTASSTGKPQKDKAPAQDKPSTVANVLKTGGSDPWGVLRWLFGVSITGALIGLGGPFWFDVATKLSTVRQKIRGSKDHKDNDESPKPDEDHKKVIEELVTSSQTTAAKEDVDDETTQQK
jgi:hypothetical protein